MQKNIFLKIKNSRYLPTLKFTAVYTLLFLLFVRTAKYTLPFFIGFIFAALVQPLYKFMRKKLSFKGGFASAVITTLIFVIIVALLCWTAFTVIKEIILFISSITNNSEPIETFFADFFANAESILGDGFFKLTADKIFEYISKGIETMGLIYNYALALFTSVPAIFTMIIVAVFSTYYFTNDFEKIKTLFASKLRDEEHKKISGVYHEGARMIKKFIKSCTVLYALTFIETLFVFILFDIKYPIFFAVLTAVADIIPILGPGTVYIPLAVVYLLTGNYFKAIVIAVSFALISLIRQFIEPKIISGSVKIHPLLVLSAVYFSLVAKNLWVLLYMLSYFLLYQVMIKAELICPLFEESESKKQK